MAKRKKNKRRARNNKSRKRKNDKYVRKNGGCPWLTLKRNCAFTGERCIAIQLKTCNSVGLQALLLRIQDCIKRLQQSEQEAATRTLKNIKELIERKQETLGKETAQTAEELLWQYGTHKNLEKSNIYHSLPPKIKTYLLTRTLLQQLSQGK